MGFPMFALERETSLDNLLYVVTSPNPPPSKLPSLVYVSTFLMGEGSGKRGESNDLTL